MADSSIIPPVTSTVTSAINPSVASNSTSSSNTAVDKQTLASNFTTFLQLLTTQLQNQNPLDPLDTNQFTQQLVQFAQVEQQLKSNDQLSTLISIEQSAQTASAIAFVGSTVVVDGATAQLSNGQAAWNFSAPKPATATLTVKTSSGQTAYSGSFTVNPGAQNFTWDGRGNDGTQWPDGSYTLAITAKDASGQDVAVSTAVQGVVDSADLSQNPPVLSVGGQTFTLDKIKSVVRPGTG